MIIVYRVMAGWIRQDLRYGCRTLLRSPGFTLVAVFTLALGIGANTAIFTVADALLLRPLPYHHPERLALISTLDPSIGTALGPFSFPRFQHLARHCRAFTGIAAFVNEVFNVAGQGAPEQLPAARVSAKFFDVLGVAPALGRAFLPAEDDPGAPAVVLISHSLWTRRYGADPKVLGRSITLDSRPYTIIGVTPANFRFALLGSTVDIWAPKVYELNIVTPHQVSAGAGFLNAVARLTPSGDMRQAQAEMDVLNRQYLAEFPGMADANPKLAFVAEDLRSQLVANVRPAVLLLAGAVGLLLLIACANVAGLLLSRALGRRKEIAVRTALGAGRADIVRQLLAESLLLAVAACVFGVALSDLGTRALAPLAQGTLPRVEEIRTGAEVLAFSLAVSLATGLLFGVLPAWQVSRPDLISGLREEGRGATAGLTRSRLRTELVVAQVALSVVLLIGAGLLLKSFARLLKVGPGVDPSHVLTMNVTLPPASYPATPAMVTFFDELVGQVERLPGVRSAAVSSALPVNPSRFSPVLFEGQPPEPIPRRPVVAIQTCSPAYFETLRNPLVRGRPFNRHDDADGAKVAIVNETLARRFWPNTDPIGKHAWLGTRQYPVEVVGISADIRNVSLTSPTLPEVYLPYPQLPTRSMNLAVRTAGDPHRMTEAARRQVSALDRDLPVTAVQTLEELLASSRSGARFTMILFGVFSAAALLLAVVGVYGTISYSVAQRTQELSIRMALGASRREIVSMVLGQGLALTLAGIAVGVVASAGLTRAMSALVFEVSPTDPATFVASAFAFIGISLVASYVPARRATRIDPAAALRCG